MVRFKELNGFSPFRKGSQADPPPIKVSGIIKLAGVAGPPGSAKLGLRQDDTPRLYFLPCSAFRRLSKNRPAPEKPHPLRPHDSPDLHCHPPLKRVIIRDSYHLGNDFSRAFDFCQTG
jgi:hypothetical protein